MEKGVGCRNVHVEKGQYRIGERDGREQGSQQVVGEQYEGKDISTGLGLIQFLGQTREWHGIQV